MMRKRVVSYTVVRIDLSEEVACELTLKQFEGDRHENIWKKNNTRS